MKKITAILVVAMMVMSMFWGCSGGDTDKDVDQNTNQSNEQNNDQNNDQKNDEKNDDQGNESKQEEVVEKPQKELEGTINVNLVVEPGAKEGWEAVAKGYMAKHPKVNVVVDLKPAEGLNEWVTRQYGAENPTADIININMAGSAAFGKSVNWMEYANDISPYSGKPWREQFNFEMQTKDLSRNEMTALSLQSVQVLWLYNQQIFEEIGVKPPSTWDEFLDISEKIYAAGYQPLAIGGDYNSFWGGQMGWLAQIYSDQTTRSMLEVNRAQEGDYLYDSDMDGVFKLDVTDPYNDDPWNVNTNPVRVVKSIKDGIYRGDTQGFKTVWSNMAKMFPKYAGGDAFFGTGDAMSLFYQGKAAIVVDGAWRLTLFKNDMDKLTKGEDIQYGETVYEGVQPFDIGTFNMPSMEGEGIEAPARTIEVAVGFIGAIRKDRVQEELVVDFIQYYSSEEGFGLFMEAALDNGFAPTGPPLVYGVQLPQEYAALFENLEFIGNSQKGASVHLARGAHPTLVESTREWYGYTQDFLTGKINVEDWAASHQKNIEKNMAEIMQAEGVTESDLNNPQNAPTGSR